MLKKFLLSLLIVMMLLSSASVDAYLPADDISVEIISLEISLSSRQKQLEDINRNINAISARLESLKSEEAEIEGRAADSRERLKYWYRFLYIDGNLSLLEMILNAEDIPDLISRVYYIESIQEYYLNHLDQLNTLIQEKKNLASELATLQSSLETARDELNSAIENIQRLIAEKQRLYQMALNDEETRRQLAEGESLLQRFQVINYLITHLSDLPWYIIEPSSIKVNNTFTGATAVIEEFEIEKVIQSDQNLRDVSLDITEDGFIIEGSSSDKTSVFTMEGSMSLLENNTLEFIPRSLTIDHLTIENEGLEEILNSSELKFTLPPLPLNLKVESLTAGEGHITLGLTR